MRPLLVCVFRFIVQRSLKTPLSRGCEYIEFQRNQPVFDEPRSRVMVCAQTRNGWFCGSCEAFLGTIRLPEKFLLYTQTHTKSVEEHTRDDHFLSGPLLC